MSRFVFCSHREKGRIMELSNIPASATRHDGWTAARKAQFLDALAQGDWRGTRAIEGIEEEVRYRGEVVGTRRRYDTRLLLAHMARLDKLAEDEHAADDA